MAAGVGGHVSSRGHCDNMRHCATREQNEIIKVHPYTYAYIHFHPQPLSLKHTHTHCASTTCGDS